MNGTQYHYDHRPASSSRISHELATEKRFQEVSTLLSNAQKGFVDCGLAFQSSLRIARHYELAYLEEQRMRIDCAHAYAILYDQNQQAVNVVHQLTRNLEVCQRDLKEAQGTMTSPHMLRQGAHNEIDRRIDHDEQVDQKEMELGIQNQQLQFRITELEHDISEMREYHMEALTNAASHIRQMEEKYQALEQLHSLATPATLREVSMPQDTRIEHALRDGSGGRRKGRKTRHPEKRSAVISVQSSPKSDLSVAPTQA